ncbi:MAG: NusB antitermination factor [Rickettsiaceae bacterium]|jgi:N utilization substance protein B|nr:NusB antitermination factor [Rickettsiaceae bacterium]
MDKDKKNHLTKRFLSRLIAVQTLYQYDFHQRQIEVSSLLKQLIENYFLDENDQALSYKGKIDEDFADSLLSGAVLAIDKIDQEIAGFLKEKNNLEEMPDVMLQILRLASFELKFMKDIPAKVIISEYVDLSACFYDAKQVTFTNGILQNIANKNRQD